MANVKLGTKAVGSIVKIKVNGASKDFIVVQQAIRIPAPMIRVAPERGC